MEFILASNNQKKLAEMQRILSPLGIEVKTAAMLGLELPADLVAIAFSVVGIFNSLSVLEGRRKDKENISYNLL